MGLNKQKQVGTKVPAIRFGGFRDEWVGDIFNNDMFDRISISQHQIKKRDYADIGEYPIVDQGADLIAGYHNDFNNVLDIDSDGVIIFGDHTRNLKYIDFNFVPGADGIQIINLNVDYNTLFIYNRLLLMEIPDAGYSRHFKFLRGRKLNIPTLPEQSLIGDFFKTIDDLISAEKEQLENYEQYKEVMLQKMFPKKGEVVPEVRFDGFTDEWSETKLGEVVSMISSPLRAKDLADVGDYPVYNANDLIGYHDTYLSDSDYISIIKDGAGVGRIRVLDGFTNVTGTMNGLTPNDEFDLNFTHNCIGLVDFTKYVVGTTIPHIYYKDYKSESMSTPILEEQLLIGDFFKTIDDVIRAKSNKIDELTQMKESFLQKMFI